MWSIITMTRHKRKLLNSPSRNSANIDRSYNNDLRPRTWDTSRPIVFARTPSRAKGDRTWNPSSPLVLADSRANKETAGPRSFSTRSRFDSPALQHPAPPTAARPKTSLPKASYKTSDVRSGASLLSDLDHAARKKRISDGFAQSQLAKLDAELHITEKQMNTLAAQHQAAERDDPPESPANGPTAADSNTGQPLKTAVSQAARDRKHLELMRARVIALGRTSSSLFTVRNTADRLKLKPKGSELKVEEPAPIAVNSEEDEFQPKRPAPVAANSEELRSRSKKPAPVELHLIVHPEHTTLLQDRAFARHLRNLVRAEQSRKAYRKRVRAQVAKVEAAIRIADALTSSVPDKVGSIRQTAANAMLQIDRQWRIAETERRRLDRSAQLADMQSRRELEMEISHDLHRREQEDEAIETDPEMLLLEEIAADQRMTDRKSYETWTTAFKLAREHLGFLLKDVDRLAFGLRLRASTPNDDVNSQYLLHLTDRMRKYEAHMNSQLHVLRIQQRNGTGYLADDLASSTSVHRWHTWSFKHLDAELTDLIRNIERQKIKSAQSDDLDKRCPDAWNEDEEVPNALSAVSTRRTDVQTNAGEVLAAARDLLMLDSFTNVEEWDLFFGLARRLEVTRLKLGTVEQQAMFLTQAPFQIYFAHTARIMRLYRNTAGSPLKDKINLIYRESKEIETAIRNAIKVLQLHIQRDAQEGLLANREDEIREGISQVLQTMRNEHRKIQEDAEREKSLKEKSLSKGYIAKIQRSTSTSVAQATRLALLSSSQTRATQHISSSRRSISTTSNPFRNHREMDAAENPTFAASSTYESHQSIENVDDVVQRVPERAYSTCEAILEVPTNGSETIGPQNPADEVSGAVYMDSALVNEDIDEASIIDTSETSEDDSTSSDEEYVPLTYQIPDHILRKAMLTSSTSADHYWSHSLYRGPNDERVLVKYCSSKQLGEKVAQHFVEKEVLGFDIEWNPEGKKDNFKDNVSMIQVASEDCIALFHVAMFKETSSDEIMPPTLKRILESPDTLKCGVNIKGDATRVRNNLGVEVKGIFELSHLHKLVVYSEKAAHKINKRPVALATQTERHLRLPLSKGPVRMSDWSRSLNYEQCTYAAADAYASYRLFDALEAKRFAMKPRPPRPARVEENLPIQVAEGVPAESSEDVITLDIDDPEATAAEEVATAEDDTVGEAEADEELLQLKRDMQDLDLSTPSEGRHTEERRSPSPNPLNAATSLSSQSHTTLETEEEKKQRILRAEAWLAVWKDGRKAAGQSLRASSAALKAYSLWHHQNLEMDQVASVVRNPPIKQTTVSTYILEAIMFERLPFSKPRVKLVLDGVPLQMRKRYAHMYNQLR